MELMDTVNMNENIEGIEPSNEPDVQDDGANGETPIDSGSGEVTQSDFDPNQWGYKYRGQLIYPKDRNHLITLAQQGHMATQRMAEINKRAQELDERAKKYQPYEQLDKIFAENPKFAQKIWDMYQRAQAGENVVDDGEDSHVGKMFQEVQSLKTEFQKLQEEKEDRALETELDNMRKAHPDHEWGVDDGDGTLEKRIMQHALDNGFNSLESAYRDMMWDTVRTNTEAEALKKAKEARLQEKKAGVVEKGGSGQRPAPKSSLNIRDANWNQIAEAAIKGL